MKSKLVEFFTAARKFLARLLGGDKAAAERQKEQGKQTDQRLARDALGSIGKSGRR